MPIHLFPESLARKFFKLTARISQGQITHFAQLAVSARARSRADRTPHERRDQRRNRSDLPFRGRAQAQDDGGAEDAERDAG